MMGHVAVVAGGALLVGLAGPVPGDGATGVPSQASRVAVFTDATGGLSGVLPAGWRIAPFALTPDLRNPHEVLAAGTGPFVRGGPCDYVPTRAVIAAGPAGAFVTLQEWSRSDPGFSLASNPRRPARWTLPVAAAARPYFGCVGPAPAHVWWRAFRDNGRAFQMLVAIGASASPAVRRQTLRLVNSLSVAPGRTVGAGPWLRLSPGLRSQTFAAPGSQMLHVSTAVLPPSDDEDGAGAQARLGPGDLFMSIARHLTQAPQGRATSAALPLAFRRGDFPRARYEGQHTAGLAIRTVRVRGQVLRVVLALGPADTGPPASTTQSLPPDAARLIRRANALLRTLALAAPDASRSDGLGE